MRTYTGVCLYVRAQVAYVCQPMANMPPSPSSLHDDMLPPASSTQQPPPSATCSTVALAASRPVLDTHKRDAASACTNLMGRKDAAREQMDESNQESWHSGFDSRQQGQRGLRTAQSESSILWTGVESSQGKGRGGLMHQVLQAKQLPPGHYVMY